jgi:uncharacterized repeat protein (TIGR01451 family)
MRGDLTGVGRGIGRKAFRATLALGCALSALALSAPAQAETTAGTHINNVATLAFAADNRSETAVSNAVATRVAERLDVELTSRGGGTDGHAFPFELVNRGNGTEAFKLTPTLSGVSADSISIVIDQDGNGIYDPTVDTVALSSLSPLLQPGARLCLLVVLGALSRAGEGTLSLHAEAASGAGQPGTVFDGRGDNGADAIVGPTGAMATASISFAAAAADASLLKSQLVSAPDGSTSAVSGAIITYRLEVAARSKPLTQARVTDSIPAGSSYIAGSLQIDGASLSDAADGDAGDFDGSAIGVALGTVPASTTRVVTFQVKIL